jgi:type IV pilus assembly protein PilO
MGKFNELPFPARVGVLILIGAVIFAGAWYGPVPGLAAMRTANTAAAVQLKDKQAENAKLRPYEGQLRELNSQIDSLERQMERQREIVPDAKSADDFIRDMQGDALQAGVEIRSFTAKPVNVKQYYSEAPFDMEIDGPYFAVLNFFEKVGTMERIVNIDDLKMSGIGSKVSAVTKRKYDYAPGESVLVACTAKTFFSHGSGTVAAPATGAKPGAMPAKATH